MLDFFKQRLWDIEWHVAIRPHVAENTFEKPLSFRVLNNTWRYWCADPFAFDYQGKTYIFMEVADRLTQKGAIGYRVIDNGKVGPIHICIKTPHHMSYPMIYSRENDIYMIPECHESEKLTIYRAVQFPDVWESVEELLVGQKVCDTNYLKLDGQEYLLTMPLEGTTFRYDTLALYHREESGAWTPCTVNPLVLGAEKARNAGHFIYHAGNLVRPSQNCGESYGEKLVLNRVITLNSQVYQEVPMKEISIKDILVDRGSFDGIHTFNASASYDVIDLRNELTFQPARIFYFIRHYFNTYIRRKR